jgi:hypothetical protein
VRQTVASVRDLDGALVEPCTPISADVPSGGQAGGVT